MAKKEITIQTIQKGKDNLLYETGEYRKIAVAPMKPLQFMKMTKIVKNTVNEIIEDDDVKGALTGLFDNFDPDMEIIEALQTLGVQFLSDSFGSVVNVMDILPNRTMEAIATLAEIDVQELSLQEMDVFFEIVEAVIEVNDFEKLIANVKKSGKLLRNRLGFRKVVQEANQTPALSPVK